jgi:hypothetical protein
MNSKLSLTRIQIAWLAGLFEGEAYFGIDKRSKTRFIHSTVPFSPFIKISMVDKDIIDRVSFLLNKKTFSPKRLTVTNKTVYTCHIGDRETLFYLLPKLKPYMGERRQKTIETQMIEIKKWQLWKKKKKRLKKKIKIHLLSKRHYLLDFAMVFVSLFQDLYYTVTTSSLVL